MLKESDVHWFPMRVRHSSLPRLQLMLDNIDKQKHLLLDNDITLESYAPVRYIKLNQNKMDFAPYLLNYIFVRSSFSTLVELKRNMEWFEPLRFVMHPAFDADFNRHDEIIYIPDKRMDDYRRVSDSDYGNVLFLRDPSIAIDPTAPVQITEGPFAGVVGTIKRIKGKRCVVLTISDRQAAAIVDVHRRHLRYLTPVELHEFGLL